MDFIGFVRTHSSQPDHENFRDSLERPGGHGANQAVAVYRAAHHRDESQVDVPSQTSSPNFHANFPPKSLDFDVQVHMIGKIGEDGSHGHGQEILEELKKNKIHTQGVQVAAGTKTGVAHVYVDDKGITKIKTAKGANAHLTPFSINGSIKDWDSNLAIVLVQLEIPVDTIRKVIEKASSQRVPIIFNPAPFDEKNGLRGDKSIFKVDHLILNAKCADQTLGLLPVLTEEDRHNDARKLEIQMRYLDACQQFHRLGSGCVIVTLGSRGAVASYLEPEDKKGLRNQKMYIFGGKEGPNPVCDQTGASDVFIGTYAVEILRQMYSKVRNIDISIAVELAIKAGGLSIAIEGSMDSIPWRDEVFQCEEDENFTSTSPFRFDGNNRENIHT